MQAEAVTFDSNGYQSDWNSSQAWNWWPSKQPPFAWDQRPDNFSGGAPQTDFFQQVTQGRPLPGYIENVSVINVLYAAKTVFGSINEAMTRTTTLPLVIDTRSEEIMVLASLMIDPNKTIKGNIHPADPEADSLQDRSWISICAGCGCPNSHAYGYLLICITISKFRQVFTSNLTPKAFHDVGFNAGSALMNTNPNTRFLLLQWV